MSRRRGRRRPGRRALDRAAGQVLARELAVSQRWAIIGRYALRGRYGAVVHCDVDVDTRKVAYPSEASAVAAGADLFAAGAHAKTVVAYLCPVSLVEDVGHWHLTSRLDYGAAG